MIPNVLTIAGTDPSGGAGVQADIKTFSALGAYGMSVMTALVAQNTQGVTRILHVPPDFVAAQMDTLFEDVRVDAVKIGMIDTAAVASMVAQRLRHHQVDIVILDPVMVAKSGDRLLASDAIEIMRQELLPLATLITPNLPEAGVLLDRAPPDTIDGMADAARALYDLGPGNVLLKGGHLTAETSPDVLFDGEALTMFPARRVQTKNTHGTGCTLSAAIAALLPRRSSMASAVADAKAYLTDALLGGDALDVGQGHGPVHHFHALWAQTKHKEIPSDQIQ
ncbi:bifunctional hydroxymethylpyrimidine kinase/phosphomethylpyrimidine kinase [Rhodophyticola sp. CCM32]|uniref:bifunctional hydroxymethylpyrimidine kinase/phosphomethylpyrimidine kinase n=1 Tax=Rhodophyticola sp. CCM32 TaxID=2916397 RepID=UPI00107F3119|nr:bifunctional hydroxymethylpyrimidine kinase/phosphomethylpyrimidine kinase [Rhodophyticola sp. CCM32]QBY00621.1 bifunctional hydroxymethylpyrimidine kinase/phosphomethylpyrimidine kinase [Rhodophyticola sp. CCM32]